MSHTPGPWEVDDELQVCAGNRVIAQMEDYGPQWEANSRLIAAAPELLAACKIALAEGDLFASDRAILEAAIAKAEGK